VSMCKWSWTQSWDLPSAILFDLVEISRFMAQSDFKQKNPGQNQGFLN
jgi:hypothetical protein